MKETQIERIMNTITLCNDYLERLPEYERDLEKIIELLERAKLIYSKGRNPKRSMFGSVGSHMLQSFGEEMEPVKEAMFEVLAMIRADNPK